jgi:hypothetical protein
LRTPHDDRPVPAAAALTGPGNALLDEVAAEVGVDKAPFGTVDRIAKGPSLMPSRRANRANSFVLKIRTARRLLGNMYSAVRYSSSGSLGLAR